MTLAREEAEALLRNAVAALRGGRPGEAQGALEALVESGAAPPSARLLLAQAARGAGDFAAEAKSLDILLEAEPANLGALLMRGAAFARGEDVRAAARFYHRALNVADRQSGLPPALDAELETARAFLAQSGSAYQDWLEAKIAPSLEAAGPRFAEALDIMLGRRAVDLQQPSVFYYPGLAPRRFFEREELDWAVPLEARTEEIKAELEALVASGAPFAPYVEQEANRPRNDFHGMLDNPDWTALYLWRDGARIAENADRCPKTMKALDCLPLSRIGSRTPVVLFSRLTPGAHIPPHHGMLNSRLICHLPLIVPPGCALRVGSETRAWEEGKLLIFDDSIEHEARNPSGETRIILLFDVWRPELAEAERDAISALFGAIDAFDQ